MRDIKIAIVTFRAGGTTRDMCGIVTAPVYIADMLQPYAKTVDIYSVRDKIPKYGEPEIWGGRVSTATTEKLNEYDYILFTTPSIYYTQVQYKRDLDRGNDTTKNRPKILDGLTTKFAILNADEQDYKIYAYLPEFTEHPYYDGIVYVSDEMIGVTNLKEGNRHFVLPPTPSLISRDIVEERAKSTVKTRSIISLARWIGCKRICEYLQLVRDHKFLDYGIEAEIASTAVSSFYNVGSLRPLGLTDAAGNLSPDIPIISHGAYDPTQLDSLCEHISFSWDFMYYVRQSVTTMKPRLAQTSIEALCRGCLPVICKEFTPDWIGNDTMLRLSYKDVNSIPEAVGSLSEEERVTRILRAYDTLDTVQNEYYHRFVDEL